MLIRSVGLRGGGYSPPAPAPPPEPVFWLDADAESGSDGASITPSDRGALGLSLTGTVTLKTGILNSRKVLRFNGTNQRLVAGSASDWGFLHKGDEWTIVLVAKTRASNPGTAMVILDNVRTSGSSVGFTCFYDDRTAQSRNDVIVTQIGRGVNRSYPMQAVTENDAFPAATWNALSIQHDLRRPINQGSVWSNGEYVFSDLASAADSLGPHSSATASNALTIGSTAGTAALYFDGDIAEILIYDKRLTMAQHAAVLDNLAVKWGLTVQYPITQIPLEYSASYDAFGVFVQAKNKSLIAVARSGVDHTASKGDIAKWVSGDGGETWSKTVLKDGITHDLDYRNVAGGVARSGTIIAFYGLHDGTDWDSIAALRSTNHGSTWSDVSLPAPTLAGFSPYGPLVELPSGALLGTFYENGGGAYTGYTLKSTDDGVTWGSRADIYSGSTVYTETAAVFISGATDGGSTLLAFARRNNSSAPIHQFKSTDGGDTWSDMGDVPGTNFTSINGVMAHPHLLSGGDLLLLVTDRKLGGAIQLLRGKASDVASNVSNWGSPREILTGYGSDIGYAFAAHLTDAERSLAAVAYQGYVKQDPFVTRTKADLWLVGVPT